MAYPKLGGKVAAWSGDEGGGLFQAPDLCGIWDLHKCGLLGEAVHPLRDVTTGL